jgi:ferrochelatase
MKSAVILMAYGSPERLADVPAYYSDIRGGRPIAPEHLADLVERYRRLGIEDSSPLKAITEQTRAALEAELGLPVFTGMKHWTPRIADAAEAAVASGAEEVVGLVLAPHYSSLSIAGYREQLERALAGRESCASSRAGTTSPASWSYSPIASAARRARRLHGAFAAGADPRRRRSIPRPAARDVAARRRGGGLGAWSFSFQSESPTGEPWLGPDILDHLEALRQQGVERVLVCPVGFVSDHLEIRWDLDVEAQEKAGELGLQLERIEMPNADPQFVGTLGLIVRGPVGTVTCVSSRTCPDWPELMEIAPELQFKHYTVAEARLPADALMHVPQVLLSEVAICCDLERHVFYASHTDEQVAEALRASHWFEVRDWVAAGRPGSL